MKHFKTDNRFAENYLMGYTSCRHNKHIENPKFVAVLFLFTLKIWIYIITYTFHYNEVYYIC